MWHVFCRKPPCFAGATVHRLHATVHRLDRGEEPLEPSFFASRNRRPAPGLHLASLACSRSRRVSGTWRNSGNRERRRAREPMDLDDDSRDGGQEGRPWSSIHTTEREETRRPRGGLVAGDGCSGEARGAGSTRPSGGGGWEEEPQHEEAAVCW